MRKSVGGFTIVELLIVIVVIAILAAISIVAYNGIQERANNAARISSAESSIKLIRAYIAVESRLPITWSSCVGIGFPNDKCGPVDSPEASNVSPTLNSELVKVGTLPKSVLPAINTASGKRLGPTYSYAGSRTVNGASNPLLIGFFLEGPGKDCVVENIVKDLGDNAYTTDNPNKFTYTNSTHTTCYAAILD